MRIQNILAVLAFVAFSASAAAQPFLVADIVPGAGSSNPQIFRVHDGHLYFFAVQPSGELGLWKMQSAEDSPQLVKSISTSRTMGLDVPREIVSHQGYMFFVVGRSEVWKSDGSPEGTEAILSNGANIERIAADEERIYFFSGWESERKLHSLGFDDQSLRYIDIVDSDPFDRNSGEIISHMGTVAFLYGRAEGVNGTKLWVVDGFGARKVWEGARWCSISQGTQCMFQFKDRIIFSGGDGIMSFNVFDETITLLVDGGAMSEYMDFNSMDDLAYMSIYLGGLGDRVYVTDGSPDGTYALSEESNYPDRMYIGTRMVSFEGSLYAGVIHDNNGNIIKINYSDGSISHIHRDENAAQYFKDLIEFDSMLHMVKETFQYGNEVWRSNGLEGGDEIVGEVSLGYDLNHGAMGRYKQDGFVVFDHHLFFAGSNANTGAELWRLPEGASQGPVDAENVSTDEGAEVEVYPNPTSGRVSVRLMVSSPGHLAVSVRDALGREVAVLHDGFLTTGPRQFSWDSPRASGVYFVHVRGPKHTVVRRVSVVR